MSLNKRSVPFNDQVREIVYNVHQFMAREAAEAKHGVLFQNPQYFRKICDRTVAATGVSRGTVSKILAEAKESASTSATGKSTFVTPSKKPKLPKTRTVKFDKFDYQLIRQTVYKMHLVEKTLPTLKNLISALQLTIDYKGSRETLRNVLRELGFVFKKTESHKTVLVESNTVRLQRLKYLRDIERFRSEGRNIVYGFKETLRSTENRCKQEPVTILDAAVEGGFLPKALLAYKIIELKCDRVVVDREIHDKWLKECLIPNLPPNSVFVIDYDQRPRAATQETGVPNSNAKISEIKEWLRKNNVLFNSKMLKPELHELVLQHYAKLTAYSIDNILSEHGHTILRMPQCHPEFNPIELLWAKLEPKINENQTSLIEDIVEDLFNSVTLDEWVQAWDQAKNCEIEHLRNETEIDKYLEQFAIKSDDSVLDVDDNNDNDSDGECARAIEHIS